MKKIEEKNTSYDLFDRVRGGITNYEETKLLIKYTENYNIELLKSLSKDISIYGTIEKIKKLEEYSEEDKQNAIEVSKNKNKKIPMIEFINHEANERNFQKVGVLNPEALLFPNEFRSIDRFKERILTKIKELEANVNQINLNIDLSDTSGVEKIIMLVELGVFEYLRKQDPFISSTNLLASAISGITGIKSTTVQSYINPIDNPSAVQENNPFKRKKTVNKVVQKLNSIGYPSN